MGDATTQALVLKYCDDGMLAPSDFQWNKRHQHSPSRFNTKNHMHYKQLFDKNSQQAQPILIKPERDLDPCELNEIKGTRMPEWSTVVKDRDVYGELGWLGNFNVKCSKNNTKNHSTTREYFDSPLNYEQTFNNSTMSNSEFFR